MAITSKKILYQNNTQQIQLFGITDSTTGSFWTTGTINGVIYDGQGNLILSGITFVLQPGGTGNYFGTVPASFEPTPGAGYVLILDGDQGGSHLHLEIPVEVRARQN